MNDERERPDPDALLLQQADSHRGKLKIYFGACAGVGKTYAMLQEAQRLRAPAHRCHRAARRMSTE